MVTQRENDHEMDNGDHVDRLRKVEPGAKDSRGRNITLILFERSIRGPRGVGGLKCSSQGQSRSMSCASHPSPSSVIPHHVTNDEDANVESIHNPFKSKIDSMEGDNTNGGSKSLQTDKTPSLKHSSYPSVPVLNKDEPNRPTPPPSPPPVATYFEVNSFPTSHTNEIRNYGELYSVTKFNWEYLRLCPKGPQYSNMRRRKRPNRGDESNTTGAAISTISIAFSPDGRTMASTHGDHSVKITCCHTGAFVRKLDGHPRTPWTVKYHPIRSNIVASGCLGFQVRVWDWNHLSSQAPSRYSNIAENNEDEQYDYHKRHAVLLNMVRLNCAIISLSFHPAGSILAVASGQSLHLWNYDAGFNDEGESTRSSKSNDMIENSQRMRPNNTGSQSPRRGRRTEIRYEHNLRCVHFPPGGKTIIIGGANPPLPAAPSSDGSGNRTGDNSYSLKLWDFDLEAALNPHLYLRQQEYLHREQAPGVTDQLLNFRRETLSNSRTFLRRALLYNDGGFDVSPDGKMLCGCAELFLPQGVTSVMEGANDNEEQLGTHQDRFNENVVDPTDNDNANVSDENIDAILDEMEANISIPSRTNGDNLQSSPTREQETMEDPRTPPNTSQTQYSTTPPSPPGRRWSLQLQRKNIRSNRRISIPGQGQVQLQNHTPLPPPLPPSGYNSGIFYGGALHRERFVPHVVMVSLDVEGGSLGQLIEATPLGSKASSVTCVKFSPSAEYCLLGYGVRENAPQPIMEQNYHPVSAVYRVRGGMKHIVTMRSGDDDVNIARFHPDSGHGFVYGTKQGRVRVLSPWPWNYYYD